MESKLEALCLLMIVLKEQKRYFLLILQTFTILEADEQVSINQMIAMIEDIAKYQVKKKYLLDKKSDAEGQAIIQR